MNRQETFPSKFKVFITALTSQASKMYVTSWAPYKRKSEKTINKVLLKDDDLLKL